jgi:hypothetical protein
MPEEIQEEVKYVTADQIAQIEDLIKVSKADREKFLIAFKIKSLEFMPMNNFATAIKTLNKKISKKINAAEKHHLPDHHFKKVSVKKSKFGLGLFAEGETFFKTLSCFFNFVFINFY